MFHWIYIWFVLICIRKTSWIISLVNHWEAWWAHHVARRFSVFERSISCILSHISTLLPREGELWHISAARKGPSIWSNFYPQSFIILLGCSSFLQASATSAHWLLVPNITPIWITFIIHLLHGWILVIPFNGPEQDHSLLDSRKKNNQRTARKHQR